MQQMQAFRQLQRARQEGCSPVALTGCAMVQKAQLALTLSSPEQPVLILTGEEAEARRLCADINTMTNDSQTALLFPSKELLVTAVEGVSSILYGKNLCYTMKKSLLPCCVNGHKEQAGNL